MKAVFKRELRALLGGLRGWGYAAVVLLGAAVSVLLNNIIGSTARFELNVYYIALSMIPATALAATDAFQAERKQNTERILYSLPLKNADIVLGKFFALCVPVLICAVGLCVFPLILMLMGAAYIPAAASAILALTVLGIAMMAIGLLISASMPNRTVAGIATVVMLAASWAAPYLADVLANVGQITILMMLSFMLVGFALTYLLSNNAYLGIIAAAVIEVPMLLSYLQGNGAAFMKLLAGGIDSLNLFEGLNSCINGLMDGGALISWLAVAVLFAFATILYIGNRRQAKRRAL